MFNAPSDYLSLHRNIQYYNTHKKDCVLDKDLSVLSRESSAALEAESQIPERIFKKIQEYYTGNVRDDKWINLLKKDIQQILNSSNDKRIGKAKGVLNQIQALQQKTLGSLQPIDWLKQGILNVSSLFDQDAPDRNGTSQIKMYDALCSPDGCGKESH
jgi:replicative superfamily II helicase